MSIYTYDGAFLTPGMLAELFEVQPDLTNVFWGRLDHQVISFNEVVDGAARDAGNTGYTDTLRPGLVLGKVTATGKVKQFDPAATDGSEVPYGVLLIAQKTTRLGSNQDRLIGQVLRGGCLKVKGLCLADSATYGLVGHAQEFAVRHAFYNMFKFDDSVVGYDAQRFTSFVAKTGNYTLVDADAGKMFTNLGAAGAVTFTLPATPKAMQAFWFRAVANQNLIVAVSGGDKLLINNDTAADSVAVQTASNIIGNGFYVVGDGTYWHVFPQVFPGVTITTAT
jgi:hypothetical protein